MQNGRVYLIGAGPGDEKLISVRGLELIKEADVIVYDRLASKKLISKAKKGCELIDAGKMPNNHTLHQYEISRILVEKAKENKKVVRLKGGDSFIFGRGGEEADTLFDQNIKFEIVPGISSFYSACAYAGIPVTYRDYASSFHVFTGHFQNNKKLDFENIAKLEGTLIFLMGMKNIGNICSGLIQSGKDGNTPAAIIEWGTTSRQREGIGFLYNIEEIGKQKGLDHPSIIIIGDVVLARDKIEWQKYRPLWGKRILLTRTTEASSEISKMLYELGAETIEFSTIKIGVPDSYESLDNGIAHIDEYNWLFFTSVNGVQSFFDRMKLNKMDIRKISHMKIFCIGERTKREIEQKGMFVDKMPLKYNSDDAAEFVKEFIHSGDKVLFPTSEIGKDKVARAVAETGGKCQKVIAYSNKVNNDFDKSVLTEIENGEFHAILFASSSQVENYKAITGGSTGGAKLISIGKMTTATAQDLGFEINKTAEISTAEGLVEAVLKIFEV